MVPKYPLVPPPVVPHHDGGRLTPTTGLVDIYTDGGCRGNPGPGGWAALVNEGPKPEEIYGAEKNTTNQRMELRAAIEGLRYLKEPKRVKLYSDSAYLLNAMNKGWLDRPYPPASNPHQLSIRFRRGVRRP